MPSNFLQELRGAILRGKNQRAVKPRSNGPAYNGNPPITEKYLSPFIMFYSYLYIGNNRNPPITDKHVWSLEIR